MTVEANGVTILVVEEDPNVRNVVRDYLNRAHFDVRTAVNGWEALKRFKESPAHLVVCRHNSQDVDGSGLREKFLLNPETREIPFLFIVPKDEPDQQVRALRSGVDDCIEHPFDPVVLVARVQAVIERRDTYLRMVRVDALTRLFNRPTLIDALREEVKRAVRYQRPASLVALDLDGFSDVNGTHGYEMGDLLLTCLSGVILTKMRSVDLAGRFSGQRFILLLPETPEAGARRLLERIQERFSVVSDGIAGLQVTFSAGIVPIPTQASDLEAALNNADEAVKTAKAKKPGTYCVFGARAAAKA